MMRLPRNLHLTLRKCCACHAIQSLRNLRVAVPMGPRSEHGPKALRTRSESGPTRRREQASFRLSGGDPNSRTGPCFLQLSILLPHARTYFLARLFLLFICLSESWLSISCRNTEVPSKLPLTKHDLVYVHIMKHIMGVNTCVSMYTAVYTCVYIYIYMYALLNM